MMIQMPRAQNDTADINRGIRNAHDGIESATEREIQPPAVAVEKETESAKESGADIWTESGTEEQAPQWEV